MEVIYISQNTFWIMHKMLKFSLLFHFFKSHCKEYMQNKIDLFLFITWKKPYMMVHKKNQHFPYKFYNLIFTAKNRVGKDKINIFIQQIILGKNEC